MKRLLPFFLSILSFQFFSCGNVPSDLDDINWLIGNWRGLDVNDLVFNENWERDGKNAFIGMGCTITPNGDTLFRETLKINLVEGSPYYVATVPENKGPVLFKMVEGTANSAVFENPEHDFPQSISYLLENNNHMTVKLVGIEKGKPKIEKLEFERVAVQPLPNNTTKQNDSGSGDSSVPKIKLEMK